MPIEGTRSALVPPTGGQSVQLCTITLLVGPYCSALDVQERRFTPSPLAGEGWDGGEKRGGGEPLEPWQHSVCRTLLLVWLLGVPLVALRPAVAQVPHGTGEVTVDDLVARALADNPDLQATQAEAEVRMKAGELLAAQRNLGFTEELLQVNRDALGLLRTRASQGAAPPLEENLLRVEVNRLEASRHRLASQVEVLALQLKTLVGLGPEAPLALQGDLHPAPVRLELSEGLRQALAARSDLLVARAEVTMAEAMIQKEKAEGRWDASVNVGYMRQDFGYDLRGLTASGSAQPIQDVFHYVGAGVSITLPVRNQNQGNIAAALASASAAQRRLALVTLTIRQEVTAAFTQYDATQRALDIYTQGVREVARQNLEVVRQTYTLGRATLLDVIAEQRRYIDVETGYTEALKQTYDAVVDIERAVGTLEH